MIIPKQFKLFGQTIKVKWNKDFKHGNTLGLANYLTNQIELRPDCMDRNLIERTFCHELVHHILDNMNYKDLSQDEKFVDVFGALIHQFIETSKGELK